MTESKGKALTNNSLSGRGKKPHTLSRAGGSPTPRQKMKPHSKTKSYGNKKYTTKEHFTSTSIGRNKTPCQSSCQYKVKLFFYLCFLFLEDNLSDIWGSYIKVYVLFIYFCLVPGMGTFLFIVSLPLLVIKRNLIRRQILWE